MASLAGCGSISEKFVEPASSLPGIGLPAGAPERPATTAAYPAVHDMPPPRADSPLNETEQQKMENDLVGARERQQEIAGTAPPKPPAKKETKPKATPATASGPRLVPVPTSSNRTIY